MFITSKQFIYYPSQQHNRAGLNKIMKLFKITSYIHQIDLLSSQINGGAFFIKLSLIVLLFFFKTFYQDRRFFTNIILLNNYFHCSIFFFFNYPFGKKVFLLAIPFNFSFSVLIKLGDFFIINIFAITLSFL